MSLAAFLFLSIVAGSAGAADDDPTTGAPEPFAVSSLRWLVETLSSPAMEGREAGTLGAERAADVIMWQFRTAGLVPLGDEGYYQTFTYDPGPRKGGLRTLRNVVGILDPHKPGDALLVAAHYDHLGVREGKVHPGADDNASGVALLCELARAYHESNPHDGPVVFAAFTGEEMGLLGSKQYVDNPLFPRERTVAAVNIDMVGRREGNPLLVAIEGLSAARRETFLHQASFDLPVSEMRSGFEAGDLASLVLARIPTMMIFTGPHADYHRPGDTPDKIDYDGLREIGLFLEKEAPLFALDARGGFTGDPGVAESRPEGEREDRPFLGTVPDFTDAAGGGVLVADVVPGSPAERAGILPGDRVTSLGGERVPDLRAYADALRARAPGDRVGVTVSRDGRTFEFEAVLEKKTGGSGSPHGPGGHPGG
ncbi:MAG: M20/M25/M40 family metallo-hydrolase [Candidatus Eisenbacteria bacterium]